MQPAPGQDGAQGGRRVSLGAVFAGPGQELGSERLPGRGARGVAGFAQDLEQTVGYYARRYSGKSSSGHAVTVLDRTTCSGMTPRVYVSVLTDSSVHAAVPHRYPPGTSESDSPEDLDAAIRGIRAREGPVSFEAGSLAAPEAVVQGDYSAAHRESARQELGALRIEIQGGWSVADLIRLPGRLEDGYKAAAALESLASRSSGLAALNAGHGSQSAGPSADDLLQAVTAFQLAGGLRLGSLRFGSPGFVEVIGALSAVQHDEGSHRPVAGRPAVGCCGTASSDAYGDDRGYRQ